MKISYLFLFVVIFFTVISAQDAQSLIKEGDELTKQFQNEKALEKYQQADKLSQNNWDIYWRISRAYVDIAEHMPSSTDEQEEAQLKKYELSFNYADKAVKLAPDKSINYLRRGIANGRIALFKGVFSAAGLVNDVKKDVDYAIKLNNAGTENLATAYYVLGRTHAKLSEKSSIFRFPLGLGWGDIDEAIANFKKAIKLRPDFIMYHLDLAKAYIEEDEYKLAREHLNKIPSLPVIDEDDHNYKSEAKKLLQQIKDEE